MDRKEEIKIEEEKRMRFLKGFEHFKKEIIRRGK